MPSKIVIIGAGFAVVWSALSVKRLINLKNKEQEIQILIIAPELLWSSVHDSTKPTPQGTAEAIDTESHTIHAGSVSGDESDINFNRLILAAGSSVSRPESIAGLQQYAFDIDSLTSAAKLETHLKSLASLPPSKARNTVAVCGAGFTGLGDMRVLARHTMRLGCINFESESTIDADHWELKIIKGRR